MLFKLIENGVEVVNGKGHRGEQSLRIHPDLNLFIGQLSLCTYDKTGSTTGSYSIIIGKYKQGTTKQIERYHILIAFTIFPFQNQRQINISGFST